VQSPMAVEENNNNAAAEHNDDAVMLWQLHQWLSTIMMPLKM